MDSPFHIPFLISWNLTKRCNLMCSHCYLDSTELEGRNELTTKEAFSVIDKIASVNPSAMLILTGGEPLLKPDIFEISEYASLKGLTVVLGTNGTVIDSAIMDKIVSGGIKGVGVSIDSLDPALHDRFRGLEGSFARTIQGIELLKRSSIDFQIQFTVTKENRGEIPSVIEFARATGSKAVNFFFLVCTGRGQKMTDLQPEEYESALREIAAAASVHEGSMMVRARCAPHIARVTRDIDPESPLLRGATSLCIAGRGYLRITPEGFVTPCPYIPPGPDQMSLREKDLKEILTQDVRFKALYAPAYNGKCAECSFAQECGGCRARAFAGSGNLMAEDGWCAYMPEKKDLKKTVAPSEPVWTQAAEERLKKVPQFLRPMVKKGVEGYAKHKGLYLITPEIMSELRKKAGR